MTAEAPLLKSGSPRRIATRRRLLDAATALFAARGLHAVTSAEIARRAGLATGTFYLHFDDKHQLFRTIVFDALDSLRARQDTASRALEPDSRAEMRAWLEEIAFFTEENRDLIRVVFGRGGESAALAEEIHEQVARDIEQRLLRQQARGALPVALHPGIAAQARAASLTRVVAWWAHDLRRATRSEIIETLLHLDPGGGQNPVPN